MSCNGVSACLRFPNQGSSLSVGDYTVDPFTLDRNRFHIHLIIRIHFFFGLQNQLLYLIAKEGFEAKYKPGDFIVNRFTNKTCQVSIVMKFVCDLNDDWKLPEGDGQGTVPVYFFFSNSAGL